MKRPRLDPIAASLASLLAELASPRSRRAYQDDWGRFRAGLEKEAGIKVIEARPRHVVTYVAKLRDEGKAKASTGRALSVIRAVYGALVRDEIVSLNPAREVKNPKVSSEPRTPWLKEDEVRRLLDGPTSTRKERRDAICLRLLFGLGWRREEVARLRVEDFRGATVTGLVKGGKKITVGVPSWLLRALDEWRSAAKIETGAILPRSAKNPQPISGDIVYQIVKKAEARAGIP